MGTPFFGNGWEGRVVEGKYPLLEWRGGAEGSGSFFTVLGGMQQATIQLILASDLDADLHLAQWNFSKGLSHPHISRILAAGRCSIDNCELVYVVTESSEASVSKIMRSGMLDAERAREIFAPILSALSYLHDHGVVHGRINPSTIQFADSQPKLSVSDVLIAGSVERSIANPGLYDAPEAQDGHVTAASDTWSLGMTMYEAMTDAHLSLDSTENGREQIVQTLPSPFREIVQDCLQLDPVRRCTIENILERLDKNDQILPSDTQLPVEIGNVAEATASIQAGEMALADEPNMYAVETAPEEPVIFSKSFERFEDAHLKRFRVMPYAVFLLAALVVLAVLLIRRHQHKPLPAVASEIAASKADEPVPEQKSAGPAAGQPAPESQSSAPASPIAHQTEPAIRPTVAENVPQNASHTESPTAPVDQPLLKAPPVASHVSRAETNGTVIKRVLPNVAPGAFEGNPVLVEAQVRVSVNMDGAVSDVEYISPGPGNYFARLAERAARSWQFKPPMQNGKPAHSVWVLRFYFARNQTEATAERERRL